MALLNKPMSLWLQKHRNVTDSTIVQLHEATIIGSGRNRICYAKPGDPSLCVKVKLHQPERIYEDQSTTEWYISRALDRRGVSHRHRPVCHGWVHTDRGPGLVVERICNTDGSPAPCLQEFIARAKPSRTVVMRMFEELEEWLFHNRIPVMELGLDNLLVRQDESGYHLVYIDGMGGAELRFKIAVYPIWPHYAWWRTRRRWPQLRDKFRAQTRRACAATD